MPCAADGDGVDDRPNVMDVATIVDVVLAVVVLETIVLMVVGRRWTGRSPARSLLPNLAAGLFLVLALRSAVHGGGVVPIAACLALAGLSHLVDLLGRRVSIRP